ncbi:rab-like protein 3 [Gastrophryne carolinensis]
MLNPGLTHRSFKDLNTEYSKSTQAKTKAHIPVGDQHAGGLLVPVEGLQQPAVQILGGFLVGEVVNEDDTVDAVVEDGSCALHAAGAAHGPPDVPELDVEGLLLRRPLTRKVLVLGDSGVGKSSLVHLLCQNQVLGNPSWTVGCSVDVRLHEDREGTPEEKTFYIELWDVGGSVGSASSVKSTRAVFYNGINGIILIHDLTNKKSSQNLYRWLLEALNRDQQPTSVLVTNGNMSLGFRLSGF